MSLSTEDIWANISASADDGPDLLDVLPDGLLVVDPDGIIQFANARAAGMFGRGRRDLIGISFGIPVVSDADAELDLNKAGKPVTRVSMKYSKACWRGKEAYVASLRDVGRTSASSEELIKRKEEAELRDSRKSAFLAEVSHELRTPINAIIGFSEMMKTQVFGPIGHSKYLEYAGDINHCGSYLLELLSGLLDLSKAEAGKFELEPESLDIHELANDCMEIVGPAAAKKQLRLSSDVRISVLQLDPVKFRQIVLNLLSNAIKFTHPGGTIDVVGKPSSHGGYRLTISDTGVGMSRQQLSRVFEPFAQSHRRSDPTTEEEGTGLGLSLAKAMTELHGGKIHVHSEPGIGTQVTLLLPAKMTVSSVSA